MTPKASAWAVSRPTTPRGGALVTGLGRPVPRSRVNRPTSTAITPWASSGQSASRSSSTALSRRRRSVGSSAVTDAVRGWGTRAASSPTVTPGPSSTSVSPPRWTRTRPSTMAYRCASTAPSSISTSPGAARTSVVASATAASTRPGTPAKRSVRCSAATRSTRPSEASAGIGGESAISARTIPQADRSTRRQPALDSVRADLPGLRRGESRASQVLPGLRRGVAPNSPPSASAEW